MASNRLGLTKDGRAYYEIRVKRDDGRELSTRWYIPNGLTAPKRIENELARQMVEFEKKVKSREILTREEKREKQAQEKREQKEKELAAAQIKTMRQYCESVYLPERRLSCAPGTLALYMFHLENYIYPAFGDIKLPDITTPMLKAMLLGIANQRLGFSSMKISHAILSGVFKGAMADDIVANNPMLVVPGPKRRKDEKADVKFLDAHQINRLRECLKSEPLIWQAYVNVTIDTGARRGEVLALHWRDIDFKSGAITFCGSRNYNPRDGMFVGQTKNGKAKTLYLSSDTLELMRILRIEQLKTGITDYLFEMDVNQPNRYIKRFCKKYDFPTFSPHTLRHSFATLTIKSGQDIVSVSKALGHRTPAITLNYYAHALQDANRTVCETLAKVLEKA